MKYLLTIILPVMCFSYISIVAFAHPIDNTFDYKFYADNNPDVVDKVGTDPIALYWHYLTTGLNEGRRGCTEFSLAGYIKYNQNLNLQHNTLYDWMLVAENWELFGKPLGLKFETESETYERKMQAYKKYLNSDVSDHHTHTVHDTDKDEDQKESEMINQEESVKYISVHGSTRKYPESSASAWGKNVPYGTSARELLKRDIEDTPEGYHFVGIYTDGFYGTLLDLDTVYYEDTHITAYIVYDKSEHNHIFDDWEIVKEPVACDEPGSKVKSCTIEGCDYTYREEFNIFEHEWEPDAESVHSYKCKNCSTRMSGSGGGNIKS